MAGRGGTGGLLAQEKLEILWGSRGPEKQWALRRGEIADIQKLITNLKQSIKNLEASLSSIKKDIDDINASILLIEGRLEDAEETLSNLEQILADVENSISQLNVRLTAAEAAISQNQTDIAALQVSFSGLDSDVNQLQTDVANLQADITTINGQILAINTHISDIEIDIADLDADITALQLAVADLQAGAASLTVTADLNTAIRNKPFQWSDTSLNIPVAGSFGRGFTIASSANDLTQVGIVNATGAIYVRFRTSGAWSGWGDLIGLHPEPYALQSNPGSTPFPAGAYTAIPFFTSTELSGGITKTGNSTFTVPTAGIYLFELEVRANGGSAGMPVVGTPLGLSIDGTTVPTSLRSGYSIADSVAATTIIRLQCMERLAAGAQRVPYILNQGASAYQVASAVLKITRLSA